MIEISETMAPVLVAALRDAIRHHQAVAETEADPTDTEEFLLALGNLEMEVRRQYTKLEQQNRDLIPYEKLWSGAD